MSNGLVLVDDLPRDARALLARAGTEIDDLQKTTAAAIAAIQKTTSAQATRLRKQMEKEIANLQAQAAQEINALAAECERKVQGRVAQAVAELEPLQQSYFQQAKLDETLAIRSQIRQLQENPTRAEPDPGRHRASSHSSRRVICFWANASARRSASCVGPTARATRSRAS